MTRSMLILLLLLISPCLIAEEPRRDGAPHWPNGVQEAEVLAVFSAEEDGARYHAYQVQWQGNDVIVEDSMGSTNHKKGDRIKFTSQVIEVPVVGGQRKKLKLLLFAMFVEPPVAP